MAYQYFPRRLVLAAAACAAFVGGAAHAATVTEADVAGGAFSSDWSAPTEITAGFGTITGTGNAGAFDMLVFTGLPDGAQTLSFTISAPDNIGFSYAAGGALRLSDQPFRYQWDGERVGRIGIGYRNPSQTFDLTVDDSFSGNLYLGLYFTYGSGLSYSIYIPSNAEAYASVPLPAGGLLLMTALGGVGLSTARRNRRKG